MKSILMSLNLVLTLNVFANPSDIAECSGNKGSELSIGAENMYNGANGESSGTRMLYTLRINNEDYDFYSQSTHNKITVLKFAPTIERTNGQRVLEKNRKVTLRSIHKDKDYLISTGEILTCQYNH